MAEERFGNYSSCCRLCLSEQFAALKPIFENDSEGTLLVQQILTFLGIEVAQTDKLSTMICESCRDKVSGWQEFKKSCSENQTKLQNWLSSWTANAEIAGMSIQIKDEPVDREESRQDTSTEQVIVKSEPCSVDEDFYENPPVLSPHRPLVEEVQVMITEVNEKVLNGYAFHAPNTTSRLIKNNKQCSQCDKAFSTSGNRLRHERNCHGNGNEAREKTFPVLNASAPTNQEDTTQNSIDSQISRNGSLPPSLDSEAELSENDVQKIQFAAGLRLKSKTVGPNQIPDLPTAKAEEAPITKIEESYLERCKALLSMLYSFRCACHNIHYNTVKRLFGHLRANYNWFPIFTCYNCLITFAARSGSMRHCSKCPRPYLENCIRLAELTKRSENRIRLYQYYKCFACETLFAFYEDYHKHIEQEHVFEEPFICCKCSKTFGNKEELQKHAYTSCYLNYYCDVCYTSYESLVEFRTHCETEHDKGFDCTFVEYHEDFKLVDSSEIIHSRKRKFVEVESDQQVEKMIVEKKFIPTIETKQTPKAEKRTTVSSKMEHDGEEEELPYSECEQSDRSLNTSYNLRAQIKSHKRYKHKYNMRNGWKNQPSQCELCEKEFSTYYNMLRHMKTHDEAEKHLQCSFCEERFRLVSELKEHLNIMHGEAHICQECGRQFETFKQLDQHRAVHLNIKVYRDSKTQAYRTKPRYACDECDAAFETEIELKKHMPLHFVKVEQQNGSSDAALREKYSCTDCDRHYLSSKGLWLHNKRHHPDRKPTPQSFKCDVCDKVCSTNAAFQSHRMAHQRMLNASPSRRQQMQQNDEDDDYFTCKRCFKVFSTKYNLRTHLKTHGVNVTGGRSNSKTGKVTKTFWCDVCHQACQGYQELQKHKQEHINENLGETDSVEDEVDVKPNLKTCEICSKIFITQLGFMKHKQKHERQKNMKAVPISKGGNFVFYKYCKVPFLNIGALSQHMSREHDEIIKQEKPKLVKKFICNICKKTFDSSGALCSHQGWHKRNHVNKSYKYDKYQDDETTPVLKQELKREIKQDFKQEVQQPTTSFKARNTCNNCGLSFASDTALQIHILEVHRNVNATLISPRCTTCQLEFTSNEAYDAHQKLHNMIPQISFKCKYCPRTFSKCESVNMHINSVHPQHTDGKIKCHECNRYFEKQNALAIHLKVHDRQKLAKITMKDPKPAKVFSCSICFSSFEIAKDLRNHIITMHPF